MLIMNIKLIENRHKNDLPGLPILHGLSGSWVFAVVAIVWFLVPSNCFGVPGSRQPDPATVILTGTAQVYDGTAKIVSVVTIPDGLAVDVSYNGRTDAPTNAGSYTVVATVTDPNYTGSVTNTFVINPASATVTLNNLSQIYDRTGKVVSAATVPPGLAVVISYDGTSLIPTNAGNYAVEASVLDSNYTGTASGTLTVTKASAAIFLNPLLQIYDGTGKSVSASTIPSGLAVILSYGGSASVPTNLGTYLLTGSISDANYAGTVTNLLVVAPGGAPVAWGYGSDGELGTGSNVTSFAPVNVNTNGVLFGKAVASVTAGQSFSLALSLDQKIFAWGYNGGGMLGNNSNVNSSLPVAVVMNGALAGYPIVSLGAGAGHCVALSADGQVFTWGVNSYGQLGNNSTTNSFTPTAVTSGALAGKFVTSIACAGNHCLALTTDGQIFSWGWNQYGQLGNNSTSNSWVPIAVDMNGVLHGKTIVQVVAGDKFSLALTSDGKVFGWGYNNDGELGNGSAANSLVPVAVNTTGALSGKIIRMMAAGNYHTLALTADGQIFAWGGNYNGQLGNNTNVQSLVPVPVVSTGALAGKIITSVTAGYGHSLAISSDGKVFGWGRNQYGQVGINSTNENHVPVAIFTGGVLAGKTITMLSSETLANHTLALAVPTPDIAPVAINQNVLIPQGAFTNLILNGTDANGDALQYAILTGPTNGTLGAINAISGAVTYTASATCAGPDAFSFIVSDGSLVSTGSVILVVTPVNHVPTATPMTVVRNIGISLKIAIADLKNSWSDVDGDAVTLAGINLLTTNDVVLTTNGNWILYSGGPNVADQIAYTINDGHGGTNTGLVNIVVLPGLSGQSQGIIKSGNSTVANFAGIPGYSYQVQRSTNFVDWTTIVVTNAPANGIFNVIDTFSNLGGVPPNAAYYRLLWEP